MRTQVCQRVRTFDKEAGRAFSWAKTSSKIKAVQFSSPPPRARLRRASLFGSVFLLALWVLENLVGERTTPTTLLAYFPQHLWGIWPLVCFSLALKNRRPKLAMLGGGALAFWAWALMGARWHPFNTTKPKGVRVVSYNVAMRVQNEADFARQIQNQNPDIVCLQESRRSFPPSRAGESPVGELVARHFPGWHRQSAGDVMTLSRFPIEATRVWGLRGTRRTLELVVQTPRGRLRVLNTHISTSFSGQASYRGLGSQLREIVPNAKQSAGARLEQLEPLRRALDADLQTPLVLCGDFNTPPRGLFYRRLRARLRDSFLDAGNGLGASFPSRFPLLRIDYIWTSRARATSFRVDEPGASDHRMVVANVAF